jgi:hypothetical protein
LPPISKGEVEDGRHVDTSIRKRQGHKAKKLLSISRAKSDSRSDPTTPRDTKVFSTHVTRPCDNQERDTQLVGYTIVGVGVIMHDNQPQPNLQ